MTVKIVATNDSIIAHARSALNEIEKRHKEPVAAVIVVLAADGSYSLRTLTDHQKIKDFDALARVEAVVEREKKSYLG